MGAGNSREGELKNEICTYAKILYPTRGRFHVAIEGAPNFKCETWYRSSSSFQPRWEIFTRKYTVRLIVVGEPPTASCPGHVEQGSEGRKKKPGFRQCPWAVERKVDKMNKDEDVTLIKLHSEYSSHWRGEMEFMPPTATESILEKLLHQVQARMVDIFGDDYKDLVWEK